MGWIPRLVFGPGRGPMVRRGDVRAAILALLAEEPMHGYQIIGQLRERSGGMWRPSAGSVYPTLQQLEDEGLVKAEEHDGRKVYALTEDGQKAAAEAAKNRAPWDMPGVEDAMSLFGMFLPLGAAVAGLPGGQSRDDREGQSDPRRGSALALPTAGRGRQALAQNSAGGTSSAARPQQVTWKIA